MIEIKLVNHKERIEELVDLFNIVMRPNQQKISLDYWKWKHLENPLNPPESKVIVAVDQERIVGANLFILEELRFKKKNMLIAQSCDTIVDPNYRRRGLFVQIIDFACEYFKEQGCNLFYGFPNSMSLPGFLKQGWQKVLPVECLLRANNPSAVITQKLGNPTLGKTLGFFYNKFYNQRPKIDEKIKKIFSVELFDYFPEALKEIDTLYRKNSLELVRSEAYFKWRVDQDPIYKYKYLLARQGEELKGYALISMSQIHNGLITGRIVDYIIKDNDIDCFRIIMTQALNELEKNKSDIVFVWETLNQKFRQELLKRFGFKSSLAFPYRSFIEENYFIVRKLNHNLSYEVDVYKSTNWRLTMLYPDLI